MPCGVSPRGRERRLCTTPFPDTCPQRGFVTDKITFLISTRVGLYSAAPLLRALLSRNAEVYIACRKPVVAQVRKILPELSETLVPLEPIEDRNRKAQKLHSLLLQSFTSLQFSQHYRSLRAELTHASGSPLRGAFLKTSGWIPSWPSDEVNLRLSRQIGRLVVNPFPSRRIVALSQADVPHLLCAPGLQVTTLMESWDHPFKAPAGYVSHRVIPWNRDLGSDWTHFQGDRNVVIGYPLKLRYALESGPLADLSRNPCDEPVAMYAASTSSQTYYRDWFADEIGLLEGIAVATARARWRLLIKPKPNGIPGEFHDLESRFPHVSVGHYRQGSQDRTEISNYYLEDNYNDERLRELASCDLVISYGTTFALDAAAANRRVLQLDLRASSAYPQIAKASKRYHLERYFLGDPSLTFDPGEGNLADPLAEYLGDIDRRPDEMTAWVRGWLTTERLDEAVGRMVQSILQ